MSDVIVRELFALLGMQTDDASFAKADSLISNIKSSLTLVAGVATAAAVAIGAAVHSFVENADEIGRTTDMIGIAKERFQELAYASQQSDVELSSFTTGLVHLRRAVQEVRDGNEETSKTFHRLHVSIRDGKGGLKDLDTLLLDVADGIARLPNEAQAIPLIMQLFGRSGAEMRAFLGQGREGIEKLAGEARELGLVMSGQTIESAQEFADTLDKIKAISQSLVNTFGAAFLPILQDLTKQFIDWYKVNQALIKQNIVSYTNKLTMAVQWSVNALRKLSAALRIVYDNIGLIVVIITSRLLAALALNFSSIVALTLGYIKAGAAAITAAGRAALAWLVAAAPVAAITAAIAAAILLIEDFIVYLQGGESLIGRLLPTWQEWVDEFINGTDESSPWWRQLIVGFIELLRDLPRIWGDIRQAASSALDFIAQKLQPLVKWFEEVKTFFREGIGKGLGDVWRGASQAGQATANTVGSGVSAVASAGSGAVDYIGRLLGNLPGLIRSAQVPSLSNIPVPSILNPTLPFYLRPGAQRQINQRNETTFQIMQQPGEDAADLASRVADENDRRRRSEIEAASAAVGL